MFSMIKPGLSKTTRAHFALLASGLPVNRHRTIDVARHMAVLECDRYEEKPEAQKFLKSLTTEATQRRNQFSRNVYNQCLAEACEEVADNPNNDLFAEPMVYIDNQNPENKYDEIDEVIWVFEEEQYVFNFVANTFTIWNPYTRQSREMTKEEFAIMAKQIQSRIIDSLKNHHGMSFFEEGFYKVEELDFEQRQNLFLKLMQAESSW